MQLWAKPPIYKEISEVQYMYLPLLFVIYINNLPNVLNSCNASLYADDTVIYCYGTSSKELSDIS